VPLMEKSGRQEPADPTSDDGNLHHRHPTVVLIFRTGGFANHLRLESGEDCKAFAP